MYLNFIKLIKFENLNFYAVKINLLVFDGTEMPNTLAWCISHLLNTGHKQRTTLFCSFTFIYSNNRSYSSKIHFFHKKTIRK